MLAVLSRSTLWYLTRGTGLVALVLLTASMVLGVMTTIRWRSPEWPTSVSSGLHRNLSLLAVMFIAVHVTTTVVDGFAPIGWLDSVVPFRGTYRPLWLGMGALASDLAVALIATSALRRRLGQRAWRAVHWLAYCCWPLALVHGLGTGTDTGVGWVLALTAACAAAVVVVIGWRIATGWPARLIVRLGSLAVTAVAVAAAVVWVALGPLQSGWARRAGTPPSLLRPTTELPAVMPTGRGLDQRTEGGPAQL